MEHGAATLVLDAGVTCSKPEPQTQSNAFRDDDITLDVSDVMVPNPLTTELDVDISKPNGNNKSKTGSTP